MFVSSAFDKAQSLLTLKRVFVYAMALAAITNTIGLALYIHVPRFAESPGADFIQFYSAALLARDNSDKIYDVEAQKEMQKRFSPGARQGVYWPYLHAPFFTVLLIPLGSFSYVEAFWVWSLLTLILYCSSVAVISRLDPARGPPLRLALAVAYGAPVFYWLIATGQTTGIAVFLWTASFALMKKGRIFWAAFVLGFLSYRVQYLAVVLPILVIRRMWLGVLGIATSCLLLVVAGGLVFSLDAYWAYIDAVFFQARRIVTLEQPLSHYVTLYGFFRSLLPHYGAVVCTVASALPLIYWLLNSWRNSRPPEGRVFDLQWALLIAATLLLMHHGFVYDLVLLSMPIMLLYPYRLLLPAYYKVVLVGLYFAPYILLIIPGKLPFNPIPPMLYWFCFQIYRVYTAVQNPNVNLHSRCESLGLIK